MTETIAIAVGEPVHVELEHLRVSIRRREVGDDGGLSIEIHEREHEREGETPRELLRFDAFRDDPHYHVPASEPKPRSIDARGARAALAFAVTAIGQRLVPLLDEAGYPEHARRAEALDLAAAARRVEQAAAKAPEPGEPNHYPLTPEVREALGLPADAD